MKTARIANPGAKAVLAVHTDDDVCAVQKEEVMAKELADVIELLDEIDRELAEAERAEQVRVSRAFNDEVRARRALRRAERGVLRSLPTRLASESEAA